MQILMFTPAHKDEFIAKAKTMKKRYPEVTIVYDLEDGVPATEKKRAFENVKKHARTKDWVRIDDNMTYELYDLPTVQAIVIPKVTPYVLDRYVDMDGRNSFGCDRVIALIETAAGVDAASYIAEKAGGVIFGQYDFILSMNSELHTDYARSRILNACKAAGIPVYDSPDYSLDLNTIMHNARQAYCLGFDGMAVLHPDHIKIVKENFRAPYNQRVWAKGILKNAGDGLTVFQNTIIGPPIVKRAKQILQK